MKDYYQLTKPGIIYGNAIAVVAGFFLASKGDISWWLLLATLAGISLIMASGCVFNNYIDRDIDRLMERTKNRALARGAASLRGAVIYGTFLGLTGVLVLIAYTNFLTILVALAGLFVYVVAYSLWFKRHSVHGTLVGSISGAVPPVVGYVAVTGSLDLGVIILFLILALWQMPHSYAIALYRLDDYIAAGIPVLPVKKGARVTKIHMLVYIVLFTFATLALTAFGYMGYVYAVVLSVLGAVWLGLCAKGIKTLDDKLWARNMFIFSIVVLVVFCIMVAVDWAIKL
ncbi:MAG: Protoheme IX farnesyltransferase [Parcubacteria group bacterium GW2011_GWA1_47_8]|nr:MAG: Protoheme IX farnesyltransferase [Parcubacteria group bacterium GW2011_GWA1_47_8]